MCHTLPFQNKRNASFYEAVYNSMSVVGPQIMKDPDQLSHDPTAVRQDEGSVDVARVYIAANMTHVPIISNFLTGGKPPRHDFEKARRCARP